MKESNLIILVMFAIFVVGIFSSIFGIGVNENYEKVESVVTSILFSAYCICRAIEKKT